MATTATIRVDPETVFTPPLLLACAWGEHPWPRGGTTGAAPRPREWHGPAGACQAVLKERRRAQRRGGWPAEARGVRGDAAGREGLGRPPFCLRPGVEPLGVASARREVHRRFRRATPERREVPKLRAPGLRQAVYARLARSPSPGLAQSGAPAVPTRALGSMGARDRAGPQGAGRDWPCGSRTHGGAVPPVGGFSPRRIGVKWLIALASTVLHA
jgi:hypothetical protein